MQVCAGQVSLGILVTECAHNSLVPIPLGCPFSPQRGRASNENSTPPVPDIKFPSSLLNTTLWIFPFCLPPPGMSALWVSEWLTDWLDLLLEVSNGLQALISSPTKACYIIEGKLHTKSAEAIIKILNKNSIIVPGASWEMPPMHLRERKPGENSNTTWNRSIKFSKKLKVTSTFSFPFYSLHPYISFSNIRNYSNDQYHLKVHYIQWVTF